MDLPICPGCGQSVLDDEAEDCPFCGASLSGKPSGKPAVKPPSKPLAATKNPAPSPAEAKAAGSKVNPSPTTGGKTPAKADTSSSTDEPFAVDQMAMSNAVPLRSAPSKGRAYQVICPMCETAGYTSPKAGGREVKCANPKCLVPIFTCPEPPPKPVEEGPPEPSGLSTTQLGLMSVVALAVVGAGLWFFVLRETNTDPAPSDPSLNNAQANKGNAENKKTTEPLVTPPTPQQAPETDWAALREQALPRMIDISQQVGGRIRNRNKPLCVQWISLAYADLGNLQAAQEQLDRLTALNEPQSHYHVLPLAEMGWKQQDRGEPAAATADKALSYAKDVPQDLHESWMEAVSLGSLLVALGRADDALPLLGRRFGDEAMQQLWADVLAVSLDQTFDLNAASQCGPLVAAVNPAWSGVVWQLVFHQADDQALAWAKRAANEEARGEALIAWGEAVLTRSITQKTPVDEAALEAAIKELPAGWQPVVSARAWARMGRRALILGDRDAAERYLATAQTALGSLPAAKPMPLPDVKTLYEAKFPATTLPQAAAVAAFEVARLLASLDQADAAWQAVQQGLATLRSLAPSPPAVQRVLDEIRTQGDFVRSDLETALSLDSADEVRSAYNTYQKQTTALKNRADARFELQEALLAQAAAWNLSDRIWEEIQQSQAATAEAPADPYLQTALPWVVLAELRRQNSPNAAKVESALAELKRRRPEQQALIENVTQWMRQGEVSKTVGALDRNTGVVSDAVRQRLALGLGCQRVKAGHPQEALTFARALFNRDPFLSEDAAELIAAFAARQGHGEVVWDVLTGDQSWPPTPHVAGYRGFVAGTEPLTRLVPGETPEEKTSQTRTFPGRKTSRVFRN